MRRAILFVAACGATLLAGSPAASAAVDRTEYVCQGTATWQVSINIAGQSSATRTLTAPEGACKKIHAGVGDDGNFSVDSFDTGDGPVTGSFQLIGVGATGVEAFVGTGENLRGQIVIAGDSLNASLKNADATPWVVTEVHTGDGSCGDGCYRTKAVWGGSYSG